MQVFYSLEEVFCLESPLSAFAKTLVRAVRHICVCAVTWAVAGCSWWHLCPQGVQHSLAGSPAWSGVFGGLQGKWELEEVCCRRDWLQHGDVKSVHLQRAEQREEHPQHCRSAPVGWAGQFLISASKTRQCLNNIREISAKSLMSGIDGGRQWGDDFL